MEWSEIMGKRDRLAALLRPHLGKQEARERANDIIQVLVCAEEEDPSCVALRMLARDLEQRTAEVVAYQVGRAWRVAALPPAIRRDVARPGQVGQVRPGGAAGAGIGRGATTQGGVARRPRRETTILGLWN